MSSDLASRSEVAIDDEELVRALFERELISVDRLMIAQRHAAEQEIDLAQALIDLHLVSREDLAGAIERSGPEPSVDGDVEATPTPGMADGGGSAEGESDGLERPQHIPMADGERQDRDLRAELLAIAGSAVPSDLLEQLLIRALMARATDVHLDPREDRYHIRFRIDSRLHHMVDLDLETGQAVVRGVKILSELRLVETRHPQDGGLSIRFRDRSHNLRVSTLPTARGEKVVLRVLEPLSSHFDLGKLGMEPSQLAMLNQFLTRPYGAVLVGGPVGAGKTTTLYSCLDRIAHPSRNVVTIEDPVEYRFPGVNQVEINNAIGLGFAEGLRAILRQDPDILMIGEIRDDETAAIGIRAAMTGVLVFSSIHASDAAGTIATLFTYGIPGFTLSGALQGVVNQRLVRAICPDCRVGFRADKTVLRALKLDPEEHEDLTLYRGAGCASCFQSGYRGRVGIFEVMNISDLIREMILLQTTKEVIRQVARDEGMLTLREAAIAKVIRGVTTLEEMYRVTT